MVTVGFEIDGGGRRCCQVRSDLVVTVVASEPVDDDEDDDDDGVPVKNRTPYGLFASRRTRWGMRRTHRCAASICPSPSIICAMKNKVQNEDKAYKGSLKTAMIK